MSNNRLEGLSHILEIGTKRDFQIFAKRLPEFSGCASSMKHYIKLVTDLKDCSHFILNSLQHSACLVTGLNVFFQPPHKIIFQ